MKKYWNIFVILVCVLCLALTGCRSAAGDPTVPGATVSGGETETTPAATTEETLDFTEVTAPDVTLPLNTIPQATLPGQVTGDQLTLGETDKLRVEYTGNRSGVTYITSADQLPDYEELAKYDNAYFEEHALLLVTETVSSGSVQVGIEAVTVEEANAVVTLSHEMQGDAGTTDMATWLLWAEVEAGLDCNWSLANPAVEPEGELY